METATVSAKKLAPQLLLAGSLFPLRANSSVAISTHRWEPKLWHLINASSLQNFPVPLIHVYKCLRGGGRRWSQLFLVVSSARTRGSGHKVEQKRLRLSIRQLFCAVAVTERWHRLPSELADSPLWRSSTATMTEAWATCSRCPWLSKVGPGVFQGHLPTSTILRSCDCIFKRQVLVQLWP